MTKPMKFFEVRVVLAIEPEHDVTGVDIVSQALQYDVETLLIDIEERELELKEKTDD